MYAGEFGVLNVRIENLPSPENPMTSYLAVLSAIATLAKPDRAGVGRDVSTWYNVISTYKDGMYAASRHIYTYHNI